MCSWCLLNRASDPWRRSARHRRKRGLARAGTPSEARCRLVQRGICAGRCAQSQQGKVRRVRRRAVLRHPLSLGRARRIRLCEQSGSGMPRFRYHRNPFCRDARSIARMAGSATGASPLQNTPTVPPPRTNSNRWVHPWRIRNPSGSRRRHCAISCGTRGSHQFTIAATPSPTCMSDQRGNSRFGAIASRSWPSKVNPRD